jgi:hypothetical protein
MNNSLTIKAFQHLSFEALKNGKKIPSISSEVCVGNQNETILESSLPLEEALDRLVSYKTRGANDAVTAEDKEILFSELESIEKVIKLMRKKISKLPVFQDPSPAKKKK